MRSEIRRLAAGLPREPGVYRFRDARGWVLYIGRATELRARVGSYGGDLRDRRQLRRMVPAVTRLLRRGVRLQTDRRGPRRAVIPSIHSGGMSCR